MEAKLNFEASAAAEGLVRHKTSNLSVVGVPQASYASRGTDTDLIKPIPTKTDNKSVLKPKFHSKGSVSLMSDI